MIVKYFIEQNYSLLLREHWFVHNNVWNEYNESMYQKRYVLESEKYKKYIQNQVNNGLSEITEHHCTTQLLIRNMKHEKMIELNNTWYKHIQECGIQCQISFFFVKQLFPDIIVSFTENPFVEGTPQNIEKKNIIKNSSISIFFFILLFMFVLFVIV
jgi:preprotein translocase subunit SecA